MPARRDDEGAGFVELEGDGKPLVPDGQYEAVFEYHETAFILRTKAAKVFLRFRIVTPGEHEGVKLFRAYRVAKLRSKPGKHGSFSLTRGQDLFFDLCRWLDIRQRPDRVSLHDLRGKVWRIRTRTVSRDFRQRELPGFARYSVVDDLLEISAGT